MFRAVLQVQMLTANSGGFVVLGSFFFLGTKNEVVTSETF